MSETGQENGGQEKDKGPVGIAGALETIHGKPLQKTTQITGEEAADTAGAQVQYACRNRAYADGWEIFYKEHGVELPGRSLLFAETIDLDYPNKKFSSNPIKRSDLIRYIGLIEPEYADFLEKLSLPEIINTTECPRLGLSGREFTKELGYNRLWLPRPQMIARWLSDQTAEIYLAALNDIESEKLLEEIDVAYIPEKRQIDPRIELVRSYKFLSKHQKEGKDIGSYLAEITAKIDILNSINVKDSSEFRTDCKKFMTI